MTDRENNNLGEEIQDIVQTAVNTMDFKELNNEITTTINTALSEVRQALGIVPVNRNEPNRPEPGTWRPVGPQRGDKQNKQLPNVSSFGASIGSQVNSNLPQKRISHHTNGNRTDNRFLREQTNDTSTQRTETPSNQTFRGTGQSGQRMSGATQGAFVGANGQKAFEQPIRQSGQRMNPIQGQKGQQSREATRNTARGQTGWHNWHQTGNVVHQGRRQGTVWTEQNQGRRGVPIPYIPVGNISGTLCSVLGGVGVGTFGLAFLVMLIMGLGTGEDIFGVIMTGMFIPLVISCFFVNRGKKIRGRLRRMKGYMKVLQVRGFSSIKELANATGSNEKFVKKDLRQMLSLGMFPEGQLDDTNTCFMATRSSCEQYRIAQTSFEQRQAEEKARLAEEKRRKVRMARYQEQEEAMEQKREKEKAENSFEAKELSPEVREAVEHGRECMRQIRETNDAIPAEDVSEKLDRLELVIDRIFYHVEKHPNQLPEIRKFMDYYLPTTLKLLKAYQEFDSQPVQGENIKTAKQEIRNTLDTINIAFENLLDSLFEDAAMDVSTDISVLQTMLKQEGLTGSEFEQMSNESMK